MKDFSIIVACDEEMGVGKSGVLPWHLPVDLKHFRDLTITREGAPQNVVIMGRKTWESIPERFRPLPGRLNVVITSRSGYVLPAGVLRASSLDEAINTYVKENRKTGKVFVIGGARVFSDAIKHPLCTRLYLTRIYDRFGCDVFFPDIPVGFQETEREELQEENEKKVSFLTYLRI